MNDDRLLTELGRQQYEGVSDADVATAIENDPSFYTSVGANRVKQWLGLNALKLRLQAWLDLAKPTLQPLDPTWMSDPANAALAAGINGVETVMTATFGDNLDIAPTNPPNPNRVLLDSLAANPQVPLTEDDKAWLVNEARPDWTEVTEARVAATRATKTRNSAIKTIEIHMNQAKDHAEQYLKDNPSAGRTEALAQFTTKFNELGA